MITHGTAAKQAASDGVVDLIDVGGGTALLRVKTAGAATLVDLPLTNPAFGSANTSGVAAANAITSTVATGTGTAATADFISRGGVVVFSVKVGMKRSIGALNQGAKTYTVTGVDLTSEFTAGERLTVTGSTGNNGSYTIVSSTFTGGNTVVTVTEAIPSATADGKAHSGELGFDNTSIASGQTVSVGSFTYDAFHGD